MLKDLRFPFLLTITITVCAIWFLPIIPRDETRYVSVAWEMWTRESFLVPLLNGMPYSHKPPLLFWLIDLSWYLFGVNEIGIRIIPMLFSLFNIFLVYKISLNLDPKKTKTAAYASILLTATLIWQIWSFAIMFDMLETFWALTGIYGILLAVKENGLRGWFLISISIAGGLLTKGPVILVHILPPLLFTFLWNDKLPASQTTWYAKTLLSLVTGIAIALLWVIPASIEGGEAYRNAILWGQTSNRIISSFAHKRSFLWYVPVLVLLFFPWIFFKLFWPTRSAIQTIIKTIKTDRTTKFCLVWFISSLLIFSLISGKQIHYLLPSLPAMILLLAHNIEFVFDSKNNLPFKFIGVGTAYIALAAICLLLPFVKIDWNAHFFTLVFISPVLLSLGLFFLFYKFRSVSAAIKSIALSTTILIFCVLLISHQRFFGRYDIKHLSEIIKEKMDQGVTVANVGTYFGQYQFLGRLNKPVIELDRDKQKIENFINNNPDCLILDYVYIQDNKQIEKYKIIYRQPYENKDAVLWKGAEYLKFLSSQNF